MQTILTITLGLITLLAVSLQRTYGRVPLTELKRRARMGDELSAALAKAVNYGHSLRAVLWLFIAVSASSFFVALATMTPVWFALCTSIWVIWIGFVWIPASRVTFVGEK